MATTYNPSHHVDVASKSQGFWSRFYERLIAARQIEADRLVRQYLTIRSDEDLAKMGLSREDVVSNKPLRFR